MSSPLSSIWSRLEIAAPKEGSLACESPNNGENIASIAIQSGEEAERAVQAAQDCFLKFRSHPAPARGELVRQCGDKLRQHKESLSQLVCLEVGKGIEEARGEVQEMIDICDFATGLSRTLGGKTLFSERPGHRMYEQWHPLGPVLCISAFNFPVAVWSWNAAIALVCGNPVIWKPSLKAPLCAHAVHELLSPIFVEAGFPGALTLVIGTDTEVGEPLVRNPKIPLVSATGSCAMGRKVAPVVAERMGRCLLELGGNNAIIVDKSADLELAARAILFGAAGTAGQRCTTTRRVFVEQEIYESLRQKLVSGYEQIQSKIGDASDSNNLVGPLIDADAQEQFKRAVGRAREEGGKILAGGAALETSGYFVQPTLVEVPDSDFPLMQEETFAPICYLCSFESGKLQEAVNWQNQVEQGLSSALFSDSLRAVEYFLSAEGSDCGIANINIGTSGAEIGGAFGGEKATGGGREAGSDSWKAYMRRQTCTINGSDQLPLAQGIRWE